MLKLIESIKFLKKINTCDLSLKNLNKSLNFIFKNDGKIFSKLKSNKPRNLLRISTNFWSLSSIVDPESKYCISK